MFLSNIMLPKHAEQDQIDEKWLGKKSVFRHESKRVGRRLIIVNKSIKETENLISQCKIEFYFTIATHENTAFGVHSVD